MNDIRDRVQNSAKRLNTQTVRMAELIEQNFDGVSVYIDQVMEDESNDMLISIDETGDMILSTDGDFMVIESGDFYPQTNGSKCYATAQTTVTYVSESRPDIIEDNLTLIEIAKACKMTLQQLTKTIQPLGQTSRQITVVTALFSTPTTTGV